MKCRLDERVMTDDDWIRAHAGHLRSGQQFITEDAGHPSGQWVRRKCPCGASHLTTTDERTTRHVREN